jgi:hypothetical protein
MSTRIIRWSIAVSGLTAALALVSPAAHAAPGAASGPVADSAASAASARGFAGRFSSRADCERAGYGYLFHCVHRAPWWDLYIDGTG